jgi:hypothetical protein
VLHFQYKYVTTSPVIALTRNVSIGPRPSSLISALQRVLFLILDVMLSSTSAVPLRPGPLRNLFSFFSDFSEFLSKTQRGERKALVRVPFHYSPSLPITWWYPIHAYIRAGYGGGKGIVILSTSRLSTYAPQQCDCGAGRHRLASWKSARPSRR